MVMDKIVPLERYTPPTSLDKLPFGTVCRDGDNLYVQLGEQDHPSWQSIGNLLEIVFKEAILDKDFMEEALRSYKEKTK
jgi:hypothetical protein